MKCNHCNAEVEDTDAFCGACGRNIERPKPADKEVCQWCDTAFKQNETHCSKCGSVKNLQTPEVEELPENWLDRAYPYGVAGVGLIVMVAALIIFSTTLHTLDTMAGNDPGLGLQMVMMVPVGLVGFIILIRGLVLIGRAKK